MFNNWLLEMNFSHRIVHLSFGMKHHNNLGIINPLDGAHELAPQEHYNYQYFLSVVPTILIKAGGRTFLTSQFAVTNYSDPIDDQDRHGSSGIYLSYTFEPISVRITESGKSFVSFVVHTCAILGGIFTSTQMINRIFASIMTFSTH